MPSGSGSASGSDYQCGQMVGDLTLEGCKSGGHSRLSFYNCFQINSNTMKKQVCVSACGFSVYV